MPTHDKQTFFLPNRFCESHSTIPFSSYNLARSLYKRAQSKPVFIPIRSMQYLAIVDGDDYWFVDSQAYAVRNERGGRMITVSWHPDAQGRESILQNLPMRVVYYDCDMSEVQARLLGEFQKAMQLVDSRYRDEQLPPDGAEIVEIDRD